MLKITAAIMTAFCRDLRKLMVRQRKDNGSVFTGSLIDLTSFKWIGDRIIYSNIIYILLEFISREKLPFLLELCHYQTNTDAIIPVSSRGAKKILSLVIASLFGGEAIPYEKAEIAASLRSSQ